MDERQRAVLASQRELFTKGHPDSWREMVDRPWDCMGMNDRFYALELSTPNEHDETIVRRIDFRNLPIELALELTASVEAYVQRLRKLESAFITRSQLIEAVFQTLRLSAYRQSPELDMKNCEQSIWEGDPYEWAENADFTISNEQGLPGYNETGGLDFWFSVDSYIAQVFTGGVQIYHTEFVNGGVSAVYRSEE